MEVPNQTGKFFFEEDVFHKPSYRTKDLVQEKRQGNDLDLFNDLNNVNFIRGHFLVKNAQCNKVEQLGKN